MAKPEFNLKALAELTGGRLQGPEDMVIKGIQSLDQAGPEEITFAVGPKYKELVKTSRAGAIILPEDWPEEVERPAIYVKDPYLAYARLVSAYMWRPFVPKGISHGAYIGKGCEIPEEVTIHPGVYIADRVKLGLRVTLYPGVVLGDGVEIGDDTTLYPNVVVYQGCKIGNRVIVHAGTVIGSDGFGYARDGEAYVKIPQVGIVVIEDDVEIGSNVSIDRAALGETRIGKGTKIDNLVQLAHNVIIGPNSILVAQVGIAGSTRLGKGVILGGQAGVVGHIEVGDGAMIGPQAGVAKSVQPGEIVSGAPAMPHRLWRRVGTSLKRLPELVKEVRELRQRVKKLEEDK